MSRTVTGIDIGTDTIKVARLRIDNDDQIEVVALGCEELGEIAHLDDAAQKAQLIRRRLKALLRRERIRPRTCVLSVSGRATRIGYEIVPVMPQWRLDETMAFQADQQIAQSAPSSYDYRILDVGDIAGQYVVMLGLAQATLVQDRLADAEAVGASDSDVDFSALALFSAYEYGHGIDENETVCVVDIGANDVGTVIVRKGALVFARTHAGGGRRFTAALQEEFGIPFEGAERIKCERGEVRLGGGTGRGTARPAAAKVPPPAGESPADSPDPARDDPNATAEILFDEDTLALQPVTESQADKPGEPAAVPRPGQGGIRIGGATDQDPPPSETDADAGRINGLSAAAVVVQASRALTREAAALCATINNSIRFCQRELKLPRLRIDRILVTGGGSRLKGLTEFMARRLNARVEPLTPLRRVSLGAMRPERVAALEGELEQCAVSIGLALSRLQERSFAFSLLPKTVKAHRNFLAREVYLYSGAALFLLALAVYAYQPIRDLGTRSANRDNLKQTLQQDRKGTERFERVLERNRQLRAEVRALEERVYSGRDLLRVLSQLKKLTVREVWFVELTTIPPRAVIEADQEEAGGPAKAILISARGKTLQEIGAVYLRGYARTKARSQAKAANRLLNKIIYGKLLRRLNDDALNGLFQDVKLRWSAPAPEPFEDFFVMEFILELQLVKQ